MTRSASDALTEHPHARANRISHALHLRVAERVEADPALVDRAAATLTRWEAAGVYPAAYATRWRALLSSPRDELLRVLRSDDEDSRALRQNTPFAGVVPPKERWAIVRAARTAAGESAK